MFGLLARLLELLYTVWPSYGGSIILFTLVIMLALAPLTFKSTRSMLAMQALQPEMKKLQNRYKDDRQKLNEEMMKFYRENKISPLGGCLPMVIQLPVFFILYEVLYKLTLRGPFGQDMGHAVACHLGGVNACVNGVYVEAGYFHPAYLDPASKLYQDLSQTRSMDSFGLDLSQSAWSTLGSSLAHAVPYILMVLFVIALTYFQQQQLQSRQPKKAEQNPTQQMMMKVMPVAMGFIYIIIPAGVVIYFLVSSLFRIGQQAMVTRTFYSGPNAIVIPSSDDDEVVPGERKSFWSQFKPAEESLPRVGKQSGKGPISTTGREKPSKSSSGSTSKRPASSRGDAPGAKSSKSAGASGTKRSGSTGSKPRGSGGSSPGSRSKKSASGAPSPNSTDASPQSGGDKRDVSAPSRSAPSRKAPGGAKKKE